MQTTTHATCLCAQYNKSNNTLGRAVPSRHHHHRSVCHRRRGCGWQRCGHACSRRLQQQLHSWQLQQRHELEHGLLPGCRISTAELTHDITRPPQRHRAAGPNPAAPLDEGGFVRDRASAAARGAAARGRQVGAASGTVVPIGAHRRKLASPPTVSSWHRWPRSPVAVWPWTQPPLHHSQRVLATGRTTSWGRR